MIAPEWVQPSAAVKNEEKLNGRSPPAGQGEKRDSHRGRVTTLLLKEKIKKRSLRKLGEKKKWNEKSNQPTRQDLGVVFKSRFEKMGAKSTIDKKRVLRKEKGGRE